MKTNRFSETTRKEPIMEFERALHLVDIENLIGEHHRTATSDVIGAVMADYDKAAGYQSGDLVHIGVNPSMLAVEVGRVTRGRLHCRRGQHGAETALIAAIDIDHTAKRCRRVCIGSGDHEFAAIAHELRNRGLRVEVVARIGTISVDLRSAADAVVELP